ncbi:Fic family protein [Flavihumibacter sp. UBA7668]|uniref:Fic family protein n=1 Tax=Flavihumibacter sp. UBA7668 TaxID=1946542 RepID=UPI0025B8D7FB|nr:Fic family protein [Flavihumibacter sp. UBA7668]
MKRYNWQQKDWRDFKFSLVGLEDTLLLFAEKLGRVSGLLSGLKEDTRYDIMVDIILAEALKTSGIEGEYPNRQDVLSSIRKNLGLPTAVEHIKDKSAEGLGEMLIDVRKSFSDALTEKKLFAWHRMLMRERKQITVGGWRSDEAPMQVISGAIGREKVHFEAPPSSEVPAEMELFIEWFNDTAPGGNKELKNAPVRAAIAHLYFESIHPFEDGNGRIGRAIAELALSQTVGRPVLLSLSNTIEADKKSYYTSLETAQQSNEITAWISYFVHIVLAAQAEAEQLIEFTLRKTVFFDQFREQLNERQIKVIQRMFDEGLDGFKGGMNARKYMDITKTSKATATRDLQDLLEMGAFERIGDAGGRSTGYICSILPDR